MIKIKVDKKNPVDTKKMAETIYEEFGGSLSSFWTTARSEKEWWKIVQEAGNLGFVLLLHKGVKNLSLCSGSNHLLGEVYTEKKDQYGGEDFKHLNVELPLLFCPSKENIDVHKHVEPDIYYHMLSLEEERHRNYNFEKKNKLIGYPRSRFWSWHLVDGILRRERFPLILTFKIMSDNRHLDQGPFIGVVKSYWHTDFEEAKNELSDLRARHPESIFTIHCFGSGNEFICAIDI